jgi:hypothetical protein
MCLPYMRATRMRVIRGYDGKRRPGVYLQGNSDPSGDLARDI